MRKTGVLLLLAPILLMGCSTTSHASTRNQQTKATTSKVTKPNKTTATNSTENKDDMSNWTYNSGDQPTKILNGDEPTTISAKSFSTPHIDYSALDKLNRAGTVTAYLTKDNLGKSKGRAEQTWKPTGWHNQPLEFNGQRVFPQNRGHLIAYTVTFNLDDSGHYKPGHLGSINNPYNLFTQTAFSNQKTMTQTEQMVRDALAQNKKVIYQVKPIFHDNDLMARAVWVQAISTDGTMKFNRYIWNVQTNINFDYATGRSKIDESMKVPGDDGHSQTANGKHYYHYNNGFRRHTYHKYPFHHTHHSRHAKIGGNW